MILAKSLHLPAISFPIYEMRVMNLTYLDGEGGQHFKVFVQPSAQQRSILQVTEFWTETSLQLQSGFLQMVPVSAMGRTKTLDSYSPKLKVREAKNSSRFLTDLKQSWHRHWGGERLSSPTATPWASQPFLSLRFFGFSLYLILSEFIPPLVRKVTVLNIKNPQSCE